MDFQDVTTRLDLDNRIKEVSAYLREGDDAMFYIRTKQSTEEFEAVFCGSSGDLSYILSHVAAQDEAVLVEIFAAITVLEENGLVPAHVWENFNKRFNSKNV